MSIAAGGPRYYVDGSIDGEITEDQQAHAREQLEARQAAQSGAVRGDARGLKQERRERREAAFQNGLAEEAAKAERPPVPQPGTQETLPAAEVFAPNPVEPQRPARPVLRAGSLQVRGNDRQDQGSPSRDTKEVRAQNRAERAKVIAK